MVADVWVHGAVVALVVAQFFIFWYLYRRSSASGTHRAGRSSAPTQGNGAGSATEQGVACPNCGAVNTSAFNYCQRCVEELPRHAGSN